MAKAKAPERTNQRYRTRKDLIEAAGRLMKNGHKPSLEEVAEDARVSRATAYRYFPNVEALLAEAPLEIVSPDWQRLFDGDESVDPEERVDRAEAAMHRLVYENEGAIRLMLSAALTRAAGDGGDQDVPYRQNRRTPLIEAALAPARSRFRQRDYNRLRAALAMIFGSESMVVFRDVLRLDEKTAREVKSWAVRALVRAALADARATTARRAASPGRRGRSMPPAIAESWEKR